MDSQEITGSLASGGRFRATPSLLEIISPEGEISATFETRFFESVTRAGQTITITRMANSPINVTASSVDEAEQLEGMLRPAPAAAATPAVAESGESKGFNSLLKWGCLGTLSVVGILAVCLIVLLVFMRDDDDDSVVAAASTSTPATSNPTSGSDAADPTSTAAPDVTAPAAASDPSPTATATAEPEPTPTPEPGPPGSARDNPVPLGETGGTENWELEVLDVVRGPDAYATLLEINQFNSPPPEGHEYVLVHLRALYTGTSDEAQDVSTFWLHSTGSARIRHDYAYVVEQSPEFGGSVFTGGEVAGWATLLAREGEDNLLLIFQPWLIWDDEDRVFLALEEGASIDVDHARVVEENELGLNRADPVPFGERAVGEDWELWIIETIRGEQAREIVIEVSGFNDEPEDGMEYLLVHIGARNAAGGDEPTQINELLFRVTGDANVIYDTPYAVDPDPRMDYYVYPGGEVTGWVTMLVPSDETNLRLVFEPWFSFTDAVRYFALE